MGREPSMVLVLSASGGSRPKAAVHHIRIHASKRSFVKRDTLYGKCLYSESENG
jgi:hypothetical protein